MAIPNNIYYNAAYSGAVASFISGRWTLDAVPADYLFLCQSAQRLAEHISENIPFDALVTTSNVDPTQLAQTTNTITADEQHRANLLMNITCQVTQGRAISNGGQITDAQCAPIAAAIIALWTEALLLLDTP
jgi:hypothetical protein